MTASLPCAKSWTTQFFFPSVQFLYLSFGIFLSAFFSVFFFSFSLCFVYSTDLSLHPSAFLFNVSFVLSHFFFLFFLPLVTNLVIPVIQVALETLTVKTVPRHVVAAKRLPPVTSLMVPVTFVQTSRTLFFLSAKVGNILGLLVLFLRLHSCFKMLFVQFVSVVSTYFFCLRSVMLSTWYYFYFFCRRHI